MIMFLGQTHGESRTTTTRSQKHLCWNRIGLSVILIILLTRRIHTVEGVGRGRETAAFIIQHDRTVLMNRRSTNSCTSRWGEEIFGYRRSSQRYGLAVFYNRRHNIPISSSSSSSSLEMSSSIPEIIFMSGDDDDEKVPRDDDEEEDEEDEEEDPYKKAAASEFTYGSSAGDEASSPVPGALVTKLDEPVTTMDWGGALGKLRNRVEDVEAGKSQNPSQALFRLLSAESPNQAIGRFVKSAKPEVVQAMGGAVGSLLGGLSSPTSGMETIVKASGDRIGALCFQLQMTGYMFRNAEYVVALKSLMKLHSTATVQDYKDAFDRLDNDKSGYIEPSEIRELLDDVYNGEAPAFEVQTFLKFFDQNNDGKISWPEFERGLGTAMTEKDERYKSKLKMLLPGADNKDDDDDDEDDTPELQAEVTGTIEIEVEGGKIVEVDAKEYMQSLKDEARALKNALRGETGGAGGGGSDGGGILPNTSSDSSSVKSSDLGGITSYIASRQGDLKSLTQGISPEIVDAMKLLVDFVLEGGTNAKGEKDVPKEQIEMEIPGAALQQLALWQLVLGYRLREAEATEDYLKLLE